VTLDQFVTEFRDFAAQCELRITGVGADQYQQPDGSQRFETMPMNDLYAWAEEELLDVGVYAAMLAIRLRRVWAALEWENR
jgi:hypothetical protein